MTRIVAVVIVLLCTSASQAASLLTPTSVTLNASSQFFSVGNLVNNSGLSGAADINNYTTITHAGSASSNAWVTNANVPNYYTALPVPVMTFDLGGTFGVSDVVAWNYSIPGNAARQVTATFSTDGGSSFANPVVFEIPQAAGSAHTISLNDTILADHVRFTIDSNWIGFGGGGDRVGLNEIKFIETELAVPEPASIAMWSLLALFAGVFVWRQNRKPRSA